MHDVDRRIEFLKVVGPDLVEAIRIANKNMAEAQREADAEDKDE